MPTPQGSPILNIVARVTYCWERVVASKSWLDQQNGKETTYAPYQKTIDVSIAVADIICNVFPREIQSEWGYQILDVQRIWQWYSP